MRGGRSLAAALTVLLSAGCGLEVQPGRDEESVADEPGAPDRRIALVVEHAASEGGEIDRRCVTLAGDDTEADGQSLLEASGLRHTTQFFRDQNSYALCSIEGEGCVFPDHNCFCKPEYWSAWRLEDEGWVSFEQGLSKWELADGQVWGLRWGDGATPPGEADFAAICAASPSSQGDGSTR